MNISKKDNEALYTALRLGVAISSKHKPDNVYSYINVKQGSAGVVFEATDGFQLIRVTSSAALTVKDGLYFASANKEDISLEPANVDFDYPYADRLIGRFSGVAEYSIVRELAEHSGAYQAVITSASQKKLDNIADGFVILQQCFLDNLIKIVHAFPVDVRVQFKDTQSPVIFNLTGEGLEINYAVALFVVERGNVCKKDSAAWN